jgi:hypothetical protein
MTERSRPVPKKWLSTPLQKFTNVFFINLAYLFAKLRTPNCAGSSVSQAGFGTKCLARLELG